jgi:alpha-amylase
MNWEEINLPKNKTILNHWRKLGQFRNNHPAIGAGKHIKISDAPYTFARVWNDDIVVVSLDIPIGEQMISVGSFFKNGDRVKDFYSGNICIVTNGQVKLNVISDIALLEKIK